MHRNLALTITVLATLIMVASVFAFLTIQIDIPGEGSIKGVGVGVYWDQQCTYATSSVDFGLMEAGSSKNFMFYLRNEGNTEFSLNMTSKKWIPVEAAEYMSLTWNREGQQMSPGQVLSCVIKLTVSPNIQDISSYTLTITISATG